MLVSGLRGSRGLGFRPSGSVLKRLYILDLVKDGCICGLGFKVLGLCSIHPLPPRNKEGFAHSLLGGSGDLVSR